jgi:DNA-binding NarL/FixJ family response regulator
VTTYPKTRTRVRVGIIEDHALFAEALTMALDLEGYAVRRIEVPQEGGSLATMLSAVLRSAPLVVLLDLDLGRLGDGTRLIEPLTDAGVAVVVMTGSTDHARWGECMYRGAYKVLAKTEPMSKVMTTLRRLRDGFPVADRDERRELIDTWRRDTVEVQQLRDRLTLLTRREQEVLGELMHAHPVHEIARMSVVSEATVRTQVKSILSKLELNSQVAAVATAYQVGWRPPAA